MIKKIYLNDFEREMDEGYYSSEGLEKLFNFLDELDEDCGQQTEFDPLMIRCEYYEESLEDILSNYNIDIDEDADEDDKIEAVRRYLDYRTTLVAVLNNGNFLYRAF